MKKFLFLGITLLCFVLKAQSPFYFYNHEDEKVYLSLNTQFAFLSVNEPFLPPFFEELGYQHQNLEVINPTKNNTREVLEKNASIQK